MGMTFFTAIGVLTVAFLFMVVIYAVWQYFIHPLFEAYSLARFEYACLHKVGGTVSFKDFHTMAMENYVPFGRDWDIRRNNIGVWRGIGDWEIFPGLDEDEAP